MHDISNVFSTVMSRLCHKYFSVFEVISQLFHLYFTYSKVCLQLFHIYFKVMFTLVSHVLTCNSHYVHNYFNYIFQIYFIIVQDWYFIFTLIDKSHVFTVVSQFVSLLFHNYFTYVSQFCHIHLIAVCHTHNSTYFTYLSHLFYNCFTVNSQLCSHLSHSFQSWQKNGNCGNLKTICELTLTQLWTNCDMTVTQLRNTCDTPMKKTVKERWKNNGPTVTYNIHIYIYGIAAKQLWNHCETVWTIRKITVR